MSKGNMYVYVCVYTHISTYNISDDILRAAKAVEQHRFPCGPVGFQCVSTLQANDFPLRSIALKFTSC